jgi:hypothetical protein
MDNASQLLALAAAVNRLVAFLKPYVGKLGLSDKVYDVTLQLIAVLAGIFLVYINKASAVPSAINVSSPVGLIFTGALVGLGSDVLNAVLDFLYAGQKAPLVGTGGPTVVVPPPTAVTNN